MDIVKYKQQHVDIHHRIDELRQLCKAGVTENAPAIAGAVVAMSSLIKLHLAAEERALYPALQRSGNAAMAQLGARFQTDMGPIAAAFDAFARRWNTAQRIRDEGEAFRAAANETMRCLWERVRLEDRDFYPKVESAPV